MTITNPDPVTYRDALNGGRLSGMLAEAFKILRLGDMVAGVRDRAITQTASPIIDLRALQLPPAMPGSGMVRVTGGLALSGAGTTIGSGNGSFTLIPKTLGVTITVVVAGNSTAFSVPALAAGVKDIVVNSATDGGGAATSTGQAILTGILGAATVMALLSSAVLATGSDGTAATGAVAKTALGGGASGGLFAIADSFTPYTPVPTGGLTVTGAANGDLTVVPKTLPRDARFYPARFGVLNLGPNQTQRVFASGGEVLLIPATNSSSVITTTAAAAVTALRANTLANALFTYTAGGTGAGIVGSQQSPVAPTQGSYDGAAVPVRSSPGTCLVSVDGYLLLMPDAVTAAVLNYRPGPADNADAEYGQLPL